MLLDGERRSALLVSVHTQILNSDVVVDAIRLERLGLFVVEVTRESRHREWKVQIRTEEMAGGAVLVVELTAMEIE